MLAIGFFLCLTLAGLSSLIALMELPIHILTDLNCECHGSVIVTTSFITHIHTQIASYLGLSIFFNARKKIGKKNRALKDTGKPRY